MSNSGAGKMSGFLHRSASHANTDNARERGDAVFDTPTKMDNLIRIQEEHIAGAKGSPGAGSPLRIFSQAKKKINEIFAELDSQVKESTSFLQRISSGIIPVDLNLVEDVQKRHGKIRGISEMVKRDHMKVVFFGRTSNGKSTVINAMLRDRILPSGIGHTTNCFIQVEGTDDVEGYAMKEGSTERYGIKSVTSLSHALSGEHLSEESLVRLAWPKSKCFLLREDVVLVDSPGIDVTPDTDTWIDKYCLDADVFVLVANAESTLMQAEKNFFHKVASKLSKPNVFILNNRWDASANEPEYMEEVRQQHLARNLEFLNKELAGISREQALERVYFVSAKEVLLTYQKREKGEPVNPGMFPEGYLMRMQDFETFERKFQETLSESAVRTKFEHHTTQGKEIVKGMRSLLETVFDTASTLRNTQGDEKRRQESVLQMKSTHYQSLKNEYKEKVDGLCRKAAEEIVRGFKEELAKLPTTVESYGKTWPTTPDQMEMYKQGLYIAFENTFLRNFEARCAVPINNAVDVLQQEMLNRLGGLLPEQVRDVKLAPLHRRPRFALKTHLSIPQHCVGFQEDLTFHFSLGFQRLGRLILSRSEMRRLGTFGLIPSFPMTRSDQPPTSRVVLQTQQSVVSGKSGEGDMVDVRSTYQSSMPISSGGSEVATGTVQNLDAVELAAILSKCGIGTGAVAFLVWRSIGWRVLAGAAAGYAFLYGAERLAWHFRTRRRVFKNQFVQYVRPQLASLIHPTATGGAHQVQDELNLVYGELMRMADESTTELSERIATLQNELKALDEVTNQSRSMKTKSVWLEAQLQSFWDQYIASKGDEEVR
ncbi:hypothetical protein RvY_11331 [Ramazzottius varieornatus]|uniref:Dynamin-type G domain-containing protein n=1 Tax=Ramazzottius varieornatus TaxID=947166 RepID=A0A1D1VFT8_RAMVA|nr:hypothetical protein RvY_11331 [Ramazzottius varieornatus]